MGLFDFLRRAKSNSNQMQSQAGKNDVPENVFIEKGQHTVKTEVNDSNASNEKGIFLVYTFLDKNFEGKGYDDALLNPDSSHLDQNLDAIKSEIERTIKRVRTYYEDYMADVDFHIKSRSRSGMVDTVEELTTKKDTAQRHLKKLQDIESDLRERKGDCQGIFMSYSKGFKNGLAAITHHSVLNKNI